jgi:hypothetical protein
VAVIVLRVRLVGGENGDVRDGRQTWRDGEPLTQLRFTSREEMPRITKTR